jgi:hypothetical protein
MMGPNDFRRIALSMPETVEIYRRGASLFRVERKTFASLEGPGDTLATTEAESMRSADARRSHRQIAALRVSLGVEKIARRFAEGACPNRVKNGCPGDARRRLLHPN